MFYLVWWEGSFLLEYWLPGVYHKVGKPIFSFYSYSSYLIVGESLVDMTEPPVSLILILCRCFSCLALSHHNVQVRYMDSERVACVVWSTLRLQGNWTFVVGGHIGQEFVICLLKDVVHSDNTVTVGGGGVPFVESLPRCRGKTGLVMVTVQGAPQ